MTAEGRASFFRCLSDGRVIINDFSSSCLITFMDTAQMRDASADNRMAFLRFATGFVKPVKFSVRLINTAKLKGRPQGGQNVHE